MNYCTPEGWKDKIKDLRENATRTRFFTYFDGPPGSIDGAFDKAEDIFSRLFLPYAIKYLGDLKDKVSLDIGYGSGGQVLAASKHFGEAIGIDVHEEKDLIYDELIKREGGEFSLLVGDGEDLSVIDKSSVDFVHSWVTFMHLPVLDSVYSYLNDIKRVLKSGGIGVVYFSRYFRSSKNQKWGEVVQDIEREKQEPKGYREGGPKSKVKSISLVITMWKMKMIMKETGFNILDYTASFDGEGENRVFHGQYGITFRKPIKRIKVKE